METLASDPSYSDVRKCGYLRKQKSMHKRYFVLRAPSPGGPSRLEYYENEKKFKSKSSLPKKSLNLETCLNINKRADAKNKFLIVVYSREDSFTIAAEAEQEQQSWFQAMVELQSRSKMHPGSNYGVAVPGPTFKEVWQVSLRPKGLGQAKNLVGIYRLCLTDKTINFVKLNSDAAAVVLQLMNIRRCGHSENYFFIEVGRSAVTGPGEFWMQVEDSVVAQNMHETILEAMKAMSEEFRLRNKSQSLSSNPISVPSRRHHANPPPSQVGFSRRSRSETVNTSPAPKHNFQRVRTCSDGNGSASRPASEDGSPANLTPTLGPKTQKNQGVPKLHPPLNHTKSTPVTSVCSPLVPSPVSLSSSSTSGHGSDCMYTQASSNSVSESPSDYGFISSDEYGSSPSDLRNACFDRSVTPELLNYLPPSLEDNYIVMGKLASVVQEGQCQRGPLRRASSREGEMDRTLSKRASLPPLSLGKLTPSLPRRRGEEYTVMSRTASRESFTGPPKAAGSSYPEGIDLPDGPQRENGKQENRTDNGYMSMLPGVVPSQSKNDDYMPMTPNSVSPPQQIVSTRSEASGYMVMSPNGSCSPDNTSYSRSWINAEKLSVGSNDSKMSGSDYMNMSPLSRSASSTPPESSLQMVEEAPKMVYAYYSLPRSYKHTAAQFEDTKPNTSMTSSQLSNSSSASSDSLSEQEIGHAAFPPVRKESPAQRRGKFRRPVSLFVDVSKASTLPRVREAPLPQDLKDSGEYVSIEFRGTLPSALTLPRLFRPTSCIGGFHELPTVPPASEYMNMDLGPTIFPRYGDMPLSTTEPKRKAYGGMSYSSMDVKVGDPCPLVLGSPTFSDYTEMVFSVGAETPKSASPKEPETMVRGDVSGNSLMDHVSDITFSIPKLSPNDGPRVVRADPIGRRRHCSETFLSVPTTVASVSLPFADHAKRHSSASFENVWAKDAGSAGTASLEDWPGTVPRHPPAACEQGLNYIDLDLVKDSNMEGGSLQSGSFGQVHGGTGSGCLNMYASIDFHKSEELNSHKTNKDGTEMVVRKEKEDSHCRGRLSIA
ncbi:insulin receptor substrate 1-B isoform X2 [Latimeria chalumnae]|uniref:insulin receptor substrate 1-B isoform X2 n=1 Tax=Latimeria chalumnae TaxID=7897 RepID=UPI0006D8F41D|nr:PREDICTED: insulin receptor substrate 1-B-like isoform X1 [Latimeria chalumnae]|eukprot:XP_005999865.2 PREDICTED: insulin receptor substrate 1-B-like isoform X1 [Latimeria chalumnae]